MTTREKRKEMENLCSNKYKPFCQDGGGCPLFLNHPGFSGCDLNDDRYVETFYEVMCGDKSLDNIVDHPSHYNQGGIECLDAMIAAYGKEATATFCLTNAFKYLWRTEHKNGIQDIDKAIWYLNKYKELKTSE